MSAAQEPVPMCEKGIALPSKCSGGPHAADGLGHLR